MFTIFSLKTAILTLLTLTVSYISNIMKVKFTIALILLFGFPLLAQRQWQEMMNDPNANFFEIVDAFESAFEGITKKKGTGCK